MNHSWISLLTALFLLSCSSQLDPGESVEVIAEEQAVSATQEPAAVNAGLVGPVLEAMDSGGYTYVLIRSASGDVWAAAPPTRVQVGQVVEVRDPMAMTQFHSGTMDRTFELIYFSSGLTVPGGAKVPTGASTAKEQPTEAPKEQVARAQGGLTVEEIIAGKDQHVGQAIVFRGKVVKFTPQVMGKNWLHVQDGSGSQGSNDLTVTTDRIAAVGDTVLIKGTLLADKDFGFGYKYDLIIEDAEVTVE